MAQTKAGALKQILCHFNMTESEYLEKIKTESYCNKCKVWKSRDVFCKDKSRREGLHKNCKGCRHKKQLEITASYVKKGSPIKGLKITGSWLENIRKGAINANKKRIGVKKVYTEEGYKKLVAASRKPKPHLRGENNPLWKGGNSKERFKYMKRHEYREWRRSVFERDKYTCQDCGDKKGGNLEAHHIKPYAEYPELRTDVDNGLTLCKSCHAKVHYKPNSIRNKVKRAKNTQLLLNFD